MSKFYHGLLFVFFALISCFFAAYFNCFCLSGDDVWIMADTGRSLFRADHGNILPVKLMYILNIQLPLMLNINPQVFLLKFNIYIYAILYTAIAYLLTNAVFLFNRNKWSFHLYMWINSIIFFSFSMLIANKQYAFWMKESCTYLRFTFAMITMLLFLNYFFRNFILKKTMGLERKKIINASLLGLLCANTSEFNAFVTVLLLIAVGIFSLFRRKEFGKNTFLYLAATFTGVIIGTVCIMINPAFVESTYGLGRVGIYYQEKQFSEFLSSYIPELMIPNVIFIILFILFILILKKMYKKQLYYYFLTFSSAFFAVCNAFYLFLYYFAKQQSELSHGDLKLLFIGCIMHNLFLLFGLILRKIKNKRKVIAIHIFVIISFVLFATRYKDIVINQIKIIRQTNIQERKYINYLEKSFLEQFNKKNEIIKLYLDSSLEQIYRDCYIRDFIPIFNKDIEPGSYEMEWLEDKSYYTGE